jgi:hypothetical protein
VLHQMYIGAVFYFTSMNTEGQLLNGEVRLKILKEGFFCSKIDFSTWQSDILKLLLLIVQVVVVNQVGVTV